MSSAFMVYTEDYDSPSLVTHDFAEALETFLHTVNNFESAMLVWSL